MAATAETAVETADTAVVVDTEVEMVGTGTETVAAIGMETGTRGARMVDLVEVAAGRTRTVILVSLFFAMMMGGNGLVPDVASFF